MRINKVQRGKAIAALKKAGMSSADATTYFKLLDLGEPLVPQITELAEEDPELFGLDADGNETAPADEDDTPPTARERQMAALRGENVQRQTFRRPRPERVSTASAAAQEAAAHLRKNTGINKPPAQQYIEPVRDINAGHKQDTREPTASATALAKRLRGN